MEKVLIHFVDTVQNCMPPDLPSLPLLIIAIITTTLSTRYLVMAHKADPYSVTRLRTRKMATDSNGSQPFPRCGCGCGT
jgi:hypothetical protein